MNSRHLAPKKNFIGDDFPFPGWASTLVFFFGGGGWLVLKIRSFCLFHFFFGGDTSKGRRTSLYDFWVE